MILPLSESRAPGINEEVTSILSPLQGKAFDLAQQQDPVKW